MNDKTLGKKKERSYKKSMITGQKDAYERLREFIKDQIADFGHLDKFAEKIGVDSRTVRYWLDGVKVPRRASIQKMSKTLGYSEDDILTWGPEKQSGLDNSLRKIIRMRKAVENKDESEDDKYSLDQFIKAGNYISVPFLKARPSGSEGESHLLSKDIKSYLGFVPEWIHSKGNPESMGVMKIFGDSMYPLIPDNSIVLVDMSRTEIVSNKVFVIEHNEGIRIKRIQKDQEDNIILVSDNSRRKIKIKPEDYFNVLGKVLWVAYEIA